MTAASDRVRTAELAAALSLEVDLAVGSPFEYGLQSTVLAMRLAESLGVDPETQQQAYYLCLLGDLGCTADAEIAAPLLADGALVTILMAASLGTSAEMMRAMVRSVSDPDARAPARAAQVVRRLPKLVVSMSGGFDSTCEVAESLAARLGLGPVSVLFADLFERWDGKGRQRLRGESIPLAIRISALARDAVLQRAIGGFDYAVDVITRRGGGGLDPQLAAHFTSRAADLFPSEDEVTFWDAVLAAEPGLSLWRAGAEIDEALGAMGDFADLASPYLTGHSAGVARLADDAARCAGLTAGDQIMIRRAAKVHDLGRVAVSPAIWQKPRVLSADEREKVRLHTYHTDRVLRCSPFLATLAPVATAHHERLDGSGYYRGADAAALPRAARLLAAADAYHAMTEERPHRAALSRDEAAKALGDEVRAGRLDGDAAAAVLEAAGHRPPRMPHPAGLTDREAEVLSMLAHGLQIKQIGRVLGISTKTASRHVQNLYPKIGVSTRAAAAVFAMQHGLAGWGERPIGSDRRSS